MNIDLRPNSEIRRIAEKALLKTDSVYIGQSAASIGYATKADLDADLTPADGVLAIVTNDATAANNGTYRKSGATGTGSWVQSSYDRIQLLENIVKHKADLEVSSTNLFDKNEIFNVIHNDGEEAAESNYSGSDFIKVDASLPYVCNKALKYTCYYDSSKTVVTGGSADVVDAGTVISLPSNVAYVRISYYSSFRDELQFEQNTVSTAYSDYKEAVPDTQLGFSKSAVKDILLGSAATHGVYENWDFHKDIGIWYGGNSTNGLTDVTYQPLLDLGFKKWAYIPANGYFNNASSSNVISTPINFGGQIITNKFVKVSFYVYSEDETNFGTPFIRYSGNDMNSANGSSFTTTTTFIIINPKLRLYTSIGQVSQDAAVAVMWGSDLGDIGNTGGYALCGAGISIADTADGLEDLSMKKSNVELAEDATKYNSRMLNQDIGLNEDYGLNKSYYNPSPFYASTIEGIELLDTPYLIEHTDIKRQIHFRVGDDFNGNGAFNIFYIKDLEQDLEGKYFENAFFISTTEDISTFTFGTNYTSTSAGSISQCTTVDIRKTLVDADTYLVRVRGKVTQTGATRVHIGAEIGNSAGSIDIKMAGFYTTVGNNIEDVTDNILPYNTLNEVNRTQRTIAELGKRVIPSYWNGKTILWMGTSIPDFADYPEQIAEHLGANVINEALSNSLLRINRADGSNLTDGSYFDERSFGRTKDEIQTRFEAEGYAQDDIDLLKENSYEKKMLGHLDADLFVFDFGFNDRSADSTDFITLPDVTTRDRNTFIGSFNYCIDQLLSSKPKARILLIGHYENKVTPTLARAQDALHEYWNFSYADVYNKTGWSQNINPATGNTILKDWIPDGVHPHKDTSGESTRVLAQIIGKYVDSM